MHIVLAHGWGFDGRVWGAVRDRLRGGVFDDEIHVLDFGYFGSSELCIPLDEPVVAVGHSFGLLWLLSQASLHAESVILGINAFTRFSRAADFPDGVPQRLIDRMLAGLDRDAQGVVNAFHERCGLSEEQGRDVAQESRTLDTNRLRQDLMRLRDGDVSGRAGRVMAALGSRDDLLVTEPMTRASFPTQRIQWADNGGHLLPLTRPDLCADFIRQTIAQQKEIG
ncbi:alpha/beta fold hydrolase [Acetobacter sp. DsW_063]|uniref:alpha/beta fold hydrolase n=1 Tax=Acetobacter sp. DsW_063 TaxID=1514894 RepID=UPI000A3AD2EE|nr:hypothetical protein [Acetobacter sp. DsW_063]OUJ14444.1 hypothetical protein HK28_13475 [Acetobacter sp. DsW_063]